MTDPAHFDDHGAWVPEDGEPYAARGFVVGLCFAACFAIAALGSVSFWLGWWA